MRMTLSRALCATTALATGALISTAALAQSTTGSSTVEELVVTGSTGPKALDGVIEQTAPKTRTTINEEFIQRQQPGQTIAETLNVVPGYNFTNNDPYGNSGGNIRVRSFDCARISFQWDGMQLNDSGNYACFTNQVGDSEIIHTADVAQGTTDVDAPSASATGGSINYVTKIPAKDMGVIANASMGRYGYKRGYLELDTGEFGPWGTRAFVSGSWTNYNKFKGPGDLDKKQFNARIYQPLRDNGDFASIAFHYNVNRNNFYNNPTLVDYQRDGYKFDEALQCIRPTPTNGRIEAEIARPATPAANTAYTQEVTYLGATIFNSCTNYYNLRINPSDTGNIRGQFKWHFADNIILTLDPTFQYVLANGGGFTAISETDNRLRGTNIVTNAATNAATGGTGRDLNGDGDTLDTITTYTPNNTNTRRFGLNASLIYILNEQNTFRLAYAYDDAHHRQTGEFTGVDINANPLNVFGGKEGHGAVIPTSDNSFLRGRDRKSIARLNMFAAEYNGKFLDDSVDIRLGVRVPYFKRELNQFCYSVLPAGSAVLCTSQPTLTTVNGVTLTNGNVFIKGQGSTQYIPPYRAIKKYDKVLPNVGVDFKFGENHEHMVYASYAEALSAPRTDQLYTVTRLADGSINNPTVQPETTQTFDVGYRYTLSTVQLTLAAYYSKFQNRIVTSFNPDTGISEDRNIGSVHIKGIDAGVAWAILPNLTYTGNLSYNKAIVQTDIQLGATTFLPTTGKFLVESPKWQSFQRVEWEPIESLSLGLQAKYVGRRFSTDVNDEVAKAYTTADFDVRWNLTFLGDDNPTYLQLNVKNIFNERYLGSIPTTQNTALGVKNAAGATIAGAAAPRYSPGSPRAYQLTLHTEF